ncbi:hypothetical protein MSIMFB_04981 [Mycobacterium simulans]|uniref:Uncharacterized protein n=1 Tax=Mycobacterium simulans TaxID=627089 RepID=A0A7Z7NC26_9MYCO|nr:hypothetical protein MSIMFB_04981 [Mycobacterium simulans]
MANACVMSFGFPTRGTSLELVLSVALVTFRILLTPNGAGGVRTGAGKAMGRGAFAARTWS